METDINHEKIAARIESVKISRQVALEFRFAKRKEEERRMECIKNETCPFCGEDIGEVKLNRKGGFFWHIYALFRYGTTHVHPPAEFRCGSCCRLLLHRKVDEDEPDVVMDDC